MTRINNPGATLARIRATTGAHQRSLRAFVARHTPPTHDGWHILTNPPTIDTVDQPPDEPAQPAAGTEPQEDTP